MKMSSEHWELFIQKLFYAQVIKKVCQRRQLCVEVVFLQQGLTFEPGRTEATAKLAASTAGCRGITKAIRGKAPPVSCHYFSRGWQAFPALGPSFQGSTRHSPRLTSVDVASPKGELPHLSSWKTTWRAWHSGRSLSSLTPFRGPAVSFIQMHVSPGTPALKAASLRSPQRVLSNPKFLQIQAQCRGHIVNKRPTSGLVPQWHCGNSCVSSSLWPAMGMDHFSTDSHAPPKQYEKAFENKPG